MNQHLQLYLSGWTALVMCIAILGSCVLLVVVLKIMIYAYRGKKFFFKEAKETFVDFAEAEYKGYIKGLLDYLQNVLDDKVFPLINHPTEEQVTAAIKKEMDDINSMEQVVEQGQFSFEHQLITFQPFSTRWIIKFKGKNFNL